jgi:hypothetical protein
VSSKLSSSHIWPRHNRLIDTDVLSAGFAGLLSAGHRRRYASGAVASVPQHLSSSSTASPSGATGRVGIARLFENCARVLPPKARRFCIAWIGSCGARSCDEGRIVGEHRGSR